MKKTIKSTIGAMLVIAASAAGAADHAAAAHWSYEGKTDPAHWAELDQANAACKLSKEQSPINIVESQAKKAPLAALDLNYVAGSAEVINNGHTVQVNLPAGSVMKVGDQTTNLLQFHFHTPSEEKINGVHYPMVAHFVHKNAEGKLSVVAVLFKQGRENKTLAPVFNALPAEGKPLQLASFSPADVLPAKRAYYKFMGSLTTPPCSDGVQWQVLKHPAELSKKQLAAFRKLYKMNARPEQPLNERVVEVSE
ncbi:carbonate dehydratase [Duganella sp. FT92W]|uniref:carbonic anhydrase n=1 Tax=Pseudoduganella rivuli TaxID=2666085 RepID=A0A7X2LPJ1_9BURK|nr:carbonic anhydrase family protein [Pseudoduganella rivuli]MRV70320.1 carbonate dehydratase [Pseudoduganella rivuli]